MSKVILGEFIFDTSSNFLFSGEKELEAEPQVLELLAYLYLHRDRYISLQELHEHVWSGRVVSDTAVRGTIKKLRNLFDDTNVADPKYIKSLSKRGYKLVCYISEYTDFVTPDHPKLIAATMIEGIAEVSGGYTAKPEQLEPVVFQPVKILTIACFVVLGVLTLLLLFFSPGGKPASDISESWHLPSQVITTISGEKKGLTISPDGQYLAFIGRLNQSEPWQIYLKNRKTKDIHLLSTSAQQPSMLEFNTDNSLFVVDEVVGNSSVYRLRLDENKRVVSEQPLVNFFMIFRVSQGQQQGEWYINAMDEEQGTAMLYRWQSQSNALERVQARSSALDHIYHSVHSPDGQWLASAILRGGQEYWLEIQEVTSLRTVYSKAIPARVGRLEWLNGNSLMKLDEQHLSVVSLSSGSEQILLEQGENQITDFSIANSDNRLYLLSNSDAVDPVFRELIVTPELSEGRIVNAVSGTLMMSYAEHDHIYYAVVSDQNKRMLVKYDQSSGNKEILFSTHKKLELLDHHPEQGVLLLHVGEQLLVVNVSKSSVEIVSSSKSLLDSQAAFSSDAQRVYFGQLIAGDWELHQFDRASQRSQKLALGYRSAREYGNGFIAVTENGALHQLDSELRQVRALGYSINTEFISRWYVKNQTLIWSDFDFVSTWLNQLDFVSGEFRQTSFPYEKMRPRFAINQNGSLVLYSSRGTRMTSLSGIDLSVYLIK
ncbi:DNA-binding protein with winged-HTH domain protein [Rheinheimera sp. A13L]|uniref:winged helix-turn-helix domain-containing protein n=1 Tax=Rheinheimera sp. A13L TaxID=506534 RepID=UPI0002124E26|nr:winged helix-turn-helix domain-containing protein [Rheinheimera sp. A13L]EGM79775.1 DNA-binding protein with winged-HTH domain protein [Rheinheimera sp. A13L]